MKDKNTLFAIFTHISIFCAFHFYGGYQSFKVFISKQSGSDISSFMASSKILSMPTLGYLIQYLVIVLILIFSFIWINALFSVWLSKTEWLKKEINNEKVSITLWALISLSILFIVNTAYFQHSLHASNLTFIWPENHLSTILCWALLLTPLFWFFTIYLKGRKFIYSTITLATILIGSLIYDHSEESQVEGQINSDDSKPNIILIGIDSLRSDLLPTHMPYLYEQLKESVVFDNSYTELGRTFPAWNTILTGMYPVQHGGRVNLIPESKLTGSLNYLPTILKQLGYATTFAYDETRFANIGQHQGFDQIISPRIGASDFLIGLISDTPLINLLSLTRAAQWLLPEIYANRAVHHSYRPDAFTSLIKNKLKPTHSPAFIAVHFCLPHWPYTLSTLYPPEYNYPMPYYPSNLRAADDQIRTLMEILENKGLLENSRILFLSDHGESWEHENPIFTSDIEKRTFTRKITGHGSDLVTDTANRVLMAFKNFPNEEALYHNRKKLSSLADITPTILNGVNSKAPQSSGQTLDNPLLPYNRWIPIETGTVFDAHSLTKESLLDTISPMLNRYKINSSGRVEIKESEINGALKQKRYGIRNNDTVITQEEDGIYLFNTAKNTFLRFKDLNELKHKRPSEFKIWCQWHSKQHKECTNTQF